jgi:hypothetical protein
LIIFGTWAILDSGAVVNAGEDLMAALGVAKFNEGISAPIPVLLDINGKVSNDYGIRAHPAHFLIDGHGELIGSALGARK